MTKRLKESPSGSTTPNRAVTDVGAMKDIYTELTEGIQSADKRCEEIGVCMSLVHDRLDAMSNVIRDLIETYGGFSHRLQQVQESSKRIDTKLDNQVQKLLDRVVEMAMVNQDKPVEAAAHRTRSDNSFSNPDAWAVGSEQADDKWPPEGCDTMELRG